MSHRSSRERLARRTPPPAPSAPDAHADPSSSPNAQAHARFGHRLADLNVFSRDAGLPDALQAGVEALSGQSLDGVRVHYDSPQPEGVGALAFAQGTDIHLGPGQEQHLAHEAWHVVQQQQGRAGPGLQAKGGSGGDDALEGEADLMGALAGGAPGPMLPGVTGMMAGMMGPLAGPMAQQIAALVQRQVDRKKMEGMLKVVPDDADPKKRKPNEVTQAEFDRYAGMYSDIREGSSSLKIDSGVDDKHKGAMMDDIAKILQTQSGRTLVGDLSAGGKDKEVVLGPSKNDDGSLNRVGASTESGDYNKASDPTKGTGSKVNYVPGAEGEFAKGRNEVKDKDGKVIQAIDMAQKFTSDTVLFHEMTHARHNATGTAKKMPWPEAGEAGEVVTQADADAEVKAGHAGAANDVGIGLEEWATAGMGKFHNDAVTENAYRKEHLALTGDAATYAERTRYTADDAPLVEEPLPPVRHEGDEK